MTTQIAVRLPGHVVDYLDAEVAASRAQIIARLVAREIRRQRALDDIEVLRAAGVTGYPDLADVASATSTRPLELT